ncbi:hypothetical protein M6D81_13820 [Paenibacillus sp. J5C_2022]|uniref:hypothetical protein n=1 Tax=Paenibacillus sp. J5C2022 TaxID=2977129 RepID=UPI0021D2B780|nr:hypothetical protein [Paenibacillus sp. J5C2022]MCU6709772.1 hypothetical protein [Paenibacillus sp. J5C2022]
MITIRYKLYIFFSIVCILMPIAATIYGIWDSKQPKVGPIGNGPYPFEPPLSFIFCFITGVVNLPVAIIRYRKYKQGENKDKD